MKLTPKQVRYIYPFLPGIVTRALRFTGRRNTLHLQETALVMEGELIRFGYIGFERLIPRALAEWTTVTVPYGRIVRVRYQRRTLLRVLIALALVFGFVLFAVLTIQGVGFMELVMLVPTLALLVVLAVFLFRAFPRCYKLVFRTRDGKVARVSFRVKRPADRNAFAARLAEYRTAAAAFAAGRGGATP
jgi:hypothetical protein